MGASIIQNSWSQSGAGFYGGAGASLTMTNGTSMVNNSAVSYGGAIHCVDCQEVTVESGASLAFNKAVEAGGACYCDGCVLFQLSNATLLNNRWVLCKSAFVIVLYLSCWIGYIFAKCAVKASLFVAVVALFKACLCNVCIPMWVHSGLLPC